MRRQLLMGAVIAVAMLATLSPASADLIWQSTFMGVEGRPHGPWDTTTLNWFDGSGNVLWDSGVAQIGASPSSTVTPNIDVYAVQAAGMHTYETATLGRFTQNGPTTYALTQGGTIQFTGADPTITVGGNGTGVVGGNTYLNTRVLVGSGQTLHVVSDAGPTRYTSLHLYSKAAEGDGRNVIDGPIVVGDASTNPVQLVMRTPDALGVPGAQGSASITINPNATMQFYPTGGTATMPTVVTKPIILNSMGAHLDLATNGGIVFQSVAGSNTDLAGGITLTGDSTILSRGETHYISGPISGQYALTIDSWNKTNVINLNGAAKSVRSLRTISTGYGDNSGRVININAPFTATDSVTIEPGYRVKIYNDGSTTFGSLNSDLITLTASNSYLYTTGAGAAITLGEGQTYTGLGYVAGKIIAEGGTIDPGLNDGIGKSTIFDLDLSDGGIYDWQLASLKDDASGGVGGTDFDQIRAPTSMVLGGTSKLNLDFSLLGADGPDSSNAFWTQEHQWTISYESDSDGGTFASIVNGWFGAGRHFTTSVLNNGGTGTRYDVLLHFHPVPEPAAIAMLAGLALLLACWRKR